MSEKLEKSVFNSTNLLWGCGALGGLAGMYFMWNRKFRSAHQEYTEEQVRDALRDFHKEFYPVYCMISGSSSYAIKYGYVAISSSRDITACISQLFRRYLRHEF